MERQDYYVECDNVVAWAFRAHTGQFNALISWAGPDMWRGNQLTEDEAQWLRQNGARYCVPTDEE